MPRRATDDLINNLRFRSTWVALCEYLLARRPEVDFAKFLSEMREVELVAVETLALRLRLEGRPPAAVEIDERLLEQGRLRRTEDGRMRFVAHGLERSMAWYQAKQAEPDHPHHDLWRQLLEQQIAFVDQHAGLLGNLAVHKPTN
jgi:hypothetical protein